MINQGVGGFCFYLTLKEGFNIIWLWNIRVMKKQNKACLLVPFYPIQDNSGIPARSRLFYI